MGDGKPLAALLTPRMLEWKLPGADSTLYRVADGPLDAVRDFPAAGVPMLDSWAWLRGQILLSNFSPALDLRIRGDFLFDPLTDPQQQVAVLKNATQALVYLTSEAIADARGNDKWSAKYEKKGDEAVDDLFIALTKANQSKTDRVGRMTTRPPNLTILRTQ